MALVSLRDISMAFGGPLLLDRVNLQIESGDRICLLGRNGAGKSTLMRIIHGETPPDTGEIVRAQGARTALLEQEVPRGLAGTVAEVVAGISREGENHWEDARTPGGKTTSIEESSTWRAELHVAQVLSHMKLDPEALFADLSAGLKRRVLLARGLVREPDLLLLDEPTNHLDIEAIQWLEDFLLRWGGTLLFVTHDRMFLRRLATRILELDRGSLIDWACDYNTFIQRKEALLEVEADQWAQFDKKLAQEEIWIRKGIKARRTRNEGRVRELWKLRETRRQRRERIGSVRMQVQEAERSGRLVIQAEDASFAFEDGGLIFRNFSTVVMRGDKVGIIGPNGSGKTTLLRTLLGELPLSSGKIRHGTNLHVIYFDQLRAQLDDEKSVQDNLADGNDTVAIDGRHRHVIGYLRDFLFTPERARSPVKILSGGERNRLLLAKLFSKPSNLLVLDEPTNDLDTETLELLEERILEYNGTVLLVSHDRAFLNNVATSTLVFEGDGQVVEYVGGYDDWRLQRREMESLSPPARSEQRREEKHARTERPRKLSFKEQKELEALPARIETLEAEQKDLYRIMGDPAFYQNGPEEIIRARNRLESLDMEIAEAYSRWEALEELSERG